MGIEVFKDFESLAHQTRAIEFAESRQFSLLNYWVGTGKTFIGATLLDRAKKGALIRMTSHKDQWASCFSHDDRTLSHSLYAKVNRHKMESLRGLDLLVIDEAHKFKSLKAQSTSHLINLIENNPGVRVVFMTGTPITRSLEDFAAYFFFASQMNLGSMKTFTDTFSFCHEYLEKHRKVIRVRGEDLRVIEWGKLKPEKHLEFLNALNSFMLSQDGAVLDLPDKVFHNRVIEAEPHLRLLYSQYLELLESNQNTEDLLDPLLHRRLIDFEKDHMKHKIYKDFDKVIILTKSIKSLKEIEKKNFVYPITIDGSTSDREKVIEDFKRSDYKFLAGTYKTLGVGFNLQFSNAEVLFDPPHTTSDLGQGLGRIHRKGQGRVCNYFSYLVKIEDKKIVKKLVTRASRFDKAGIQYAKEYLASVEREGGKL